MKIVQGQRPDVTPAQLFALLGAGIPIVASLLAAFGVYDLTAEQQDALNKTVQWAGLVAIGLFGADFGIRAARNRADATVKSTALANPMQPPIGPIDAPMAVAASTPVAAAAPVAVQPGLPSDEEEFATGGPDDGVALFTAFTPADPVLNGDTEQGPDSRVAPVDPDEVI
jgi:hypothetical protein